MSQTETAIQTKHAMLLSGFYHSFEDITFLIFMILLRIAVCNLTQKMELHLYFQQPDNKMKSTF